MKALPERSANELPKGLSIEKPGSNLASLSMTSSMQQIVGTVIRQWTAPEKFKPLAKHGIFPIRQLLFYGPPGNGKTSACQWISQKLTVPLYRVRCDQLIEAYLGRTATNVAGVMDWLRGKPPAVILFDEVESIFPSRKANEGACGREMSAAMTVYWQCLDRWTDQHLFVLATNMAETLDPALKSRIELHLEFGPPTPDQTREVIAYWSEVLHEYGATDWSASLLKWIDDGNQFTSFRELWQTIQRSVTAHVTRSLEGT
jgi:ATP-dependent 26S proteasome regulatory subunit